MMISSVSSEAVSGSFRIPRLLGAEELLEAAPYNTIDESGEPLIHTSSFLELICWALANQLLINLACMIIGCLSLSNFCL